MEEGAGMPPRRRRSASLHPQIQPSEQGAGVTCRRSPCLHPQIQASEEGDGVTRPRSTSPAAPESLPFDDDMLREILIRLPPQPSSLPRASAVCKRWLGLVTDPKFHRQFYAHHRKPPLLGVFSWSYDEGIVFNPIPDPPDRIPPQRFDRIPSGYLLDCRHGRLLVRGQAINMQDDVLVCDPITGEQHHVVVPSELKRGYLDGAVVCAAGDHGHVHGGCHSSSYKVVLVSTDPSDNQCLARVYSFETGKWSNLSSAETRGYGTPYEMKPFYVEDVPATLVGNCLYWSTGPHILEFDLDRQNLRARILEFDLDRQNLALIMGPPVTNGTSCGSQIIQAADGDVGYAILLYPRLEMWQRNIDGHGDAKWFLSKTIEMHTILPPPSPHEEMQVQLLEYDEDDVVFLSCHGSVYMVQLKLMQSKKLNEIYSTENRYCSFKSFFTPEKKWTLGQTSFLVFMMKEYADAGKFRGQNGWTKEGWNAMTNRLNLRHPEAEFTMKQVKDREQRLKQDHNVVKSILEKSGFGWDPEKGVPTAPDEKWDELSKEQQKWRYKAFPHYDVLYEIYDGKIASGKHCKRTIDSIGERYNLPHYPEHGSYTEEILRETGLESPKATLSAPGSSIPQYDWSQNIYGDDVDLSYGGFTEPEGSNAHQFSAVEDQTCVESPRKKRLRNSKGSDGGSDKSKAKKGKDAVLENLVSVRAEELKTYKEIKTKQIDSYIDVKMAQMERNDPKNDPYGMPNCIQKLKTLGLTPSEQYKMINHLKADFLNRQAFMEVEADVLDIIIKEVVQPQV